jgi:hypothetical protein
MFHLLKLLNSLLRRAEPRHDIDEARLADAVDIYDLERRIRALDERGRNASCGFTPGLYSR